MDFLVQTTHLLLGLMSLFIPSAPSAHSESIFCTEASMISLKYKLFYEFLIQNTEFRMKPKLFAMDLGLDI